MPFSDSYPDESRFPIRNEAWWLDVGPGGFRNGTFCGFPENQPSLNLINVAGSRLAYLMVCGSSPLLAWGRLLHIRVSPGHELILKKSQGTETIRSLGEPHPFTVRSHTITGSSYYFYTRFGQEEPVLRYPRTTVAGTNLVWSDPVVGYIDYSDEYIDWDGNSGSRNFTGAYKLSLSEREDPVLPENPSPSPPPPPPPPPSPPPPICDIQIGTDTDDGYFCLSNSEYQDFLARNRRSNERLDRIVNNLEAFR